MDSLGSLYNSPDCRQDKRSVMLNTLVVPDGANSSLSESFSESSQGLSIRQANTCPPFSYIPVYALPGAGLKHLLGLHTHHTHFFLLLFLLSALLIS